MTEMHLGVIKWEGRIENFPSSNEPCIWFLVMPTDDNINRIKKQCINALKMQFSQIFIMIPTSKNFEKKKKHVTGLVIVNIYFFYLDIC